MSYESRDGLTTYLLMVLTTAFWGASFVAGKIALPEFPPMTLTFFRFLIATAIIFPYMWIKDETKVPKRKDVPLLFGLGFLGVSGFFALMFNSLLYTSAANSAIINALNPLTSSVIATFLTDERLDSKKLGLIFLALFGVLLTVTGGDIDVLFSLGFNKGDMIMVGAMLCFAIYGVYSRRATSRYSPLLVTGYIFLFALIQITPFMLMEGVLGDVLSYSLEAWAAVVFMAVFSSVLGYLIQQVTIKKIGVNKSSIFINFVPIFTILFSYLVLGDTVTIINLASAALIITAVYLNSRLH
jgi:drug/metabolite transporter (DMT)-like permease